MTERRALCLLQQCDKPSEPFSRKARSWSCGPEPSVRHDRDRPLQCAIIMLSDSGRFRAETGAELWFLAYLARCEQSVCNSAFFRRDAVQPLALRQRHAMAAYLPPPP